MFAVSFFCAQHKFFRSFLFLICLFAGSVFRDSVFSFGQDVYGLGAREEAKRQHRYFISSCYKYSRSMILSLLVCWLDIPLFVLFRLVKVITANGGAKDQNWRGPLF